MYSGCSVFDPPEIAALPRNFALEQFLGLQNISQCSLDLVLAFLKRPPVEPLEVSSFKHLMHKTMFWWYWPLGGTTARSTVSLFFSADSVDQFTLVELHVILSKNQPPSDSLPLIRISALTTC